MNNQSNENKNGTNISKGVSKEEIELFKRAIEEALELKIRKIEEEIKGPKANKNLMIFSESNETKWGLCEQDFEEKHAQLR